MAASRSALCRWRSAVARFRQSWSCSCSGVDSSLRATGPSVLGWAPSRPCRQTGSPSQCNVGECEDCCCWGV